MHTRLCTRFCTYVLVCIQTSIHGSWPKKKLVRVRMDIHRNPNTLTYLHAGGHKKRSVCSCHVNDPYHCDQSAVHAGVVAIAASPTHSMLLKSDGTVWMSGLNTKGALGLGTNQALADKFTKVPNLSGMSPRLMDRWMDGWMDGWAGGWVGG